MFKPKLIYIISEIDKSLHFEWISEPLSRDYNLSFILIGKADTQLGTFLKQREIPVHFVEYNSKRSFFSAWLRVFWLILIKRPNIVHTHLWIANLIGLTSTWLLRVPRRIYTRHHAMVHYDEFPSGLKWDKLCNVLATDIIAISKNIHDILVNNDRADIGKIHLLHHGFDFQYFQVTGEARVQHLLAKYELDNSSRPVIGVISRYIKWKGIQFIIPAFEKLLIKYPNAHLILSNSNGDYANEIDKLLKTISKNNYTEIRFEYDLAALYRLFDIFIHVPTDSLSEAFGQTYVEPLIVGIPCIFTKSGVAREFIIDRRNALVVDFQNSEQIYEAAVLILEDPSLRKSIVEEGKESVREFTIEGYIRKLIELYTH